MEMQDETDRKGKLHELVLVITESGVVCSSTSYFTKPGLRNCQTRGWATRLAVWATHHCRGSTDLACFHKGWSETLAVDRNLSTKREDCQRWRTSIIVVWESCF